MFLHLVIFQSFVLRLFLSHCIQPCSLIKSYHSQQSIKFNMDIRRLILLILGVYCVAVRGRLKIINGNDADDNEYPFMVRILAAVGGYEGHLCGASLIRPNIVLTAAHCVEEDFKYSVVVGDHKDGETGLHEREVQISRIMIHEDYGSPLGAPINDVAVLVLAQNVELKENAIETIALAQNEDFYEEGTSVTVIGWGQNENYTSPDVLQELEYKVADQAACMEHWARGTGLNLTEVTEALKGQVCIIDPDLESSAYYGDSGGPLFVKSGGNVTQIGLVSWGQPYEAGISYNMFTNTYYYLDWIEEKIASADVNNKTIHDFIKITDIKTKMKKVKGSEYKKGSVTCKVEEQKPGIDVKSQVKMSLIELHEETGTVDFISLMKHKKRWPKSGTNAFSAWFGPKNKLTEESCLICVAVLEGEDLIGNNSSTYAFSDGCPDYYGQQNLMSMGKDGWSF